MFTNFSKTAIFFVLVSASSGAYAYIDPGTGSAIIQGLLASVALVGVTLRTYWYKICEFFKLGKTNHTEFLDSSNKNNSD